MLLTNKAEILDAMNEELAEASASSIKWLADTFNVPLTHKKKRHVLSASTEIQTVPSRNRVNVVGIIKKKYSREKPVVVSVVVSNSRKQYMLKLNPDDILQLEKQNKAFPVEFGRKSKYSEHRKPKRHLPTQ
jgi:hypothetical protein